MKIKPFPICLFVSLLLCICGSGRDLFVDWSLDLREPSHAKAPDLRVFHPEKRLIYILEGEDRDALADRCHYLLPDDIVGQCYLSFAGGMNSSSPLDGAHGVNIALDSQKVETKFPSASLFCEVVVPHSASTTHKEIDIFKLSADGIPLATWTWRNSLGNNVRPGASKFIVPFVSSGKYLAYVRELGPDDVWNYVFVKAFNVNEEDLLRHDAKMKISDLLASPKKYKLAFDLRDSHLGPIVVSSSPFACTFITLSHDGKVLHQSKSED